MMHANKNKLTHIDSSGNPSMVDVGDKNVTRRTARARSVVSLPAPVVQALKDGEIQSKKGPVFHTAIIAGTMAAKKTAELIPFCHALGLENCKIEISVNDSNEEVIDCVVSITAKTGVEMEALTGASVAALTIYDMCKALSHDIVIRETRLISKQGGKHDFRKDD